MLLPGFPEDPNQSVLPRMLNKMETWRFLLEEKQIGKGPWYGKAECHQAISSPLCKVVFVWLVGWLFFSCPLYIIYI